MPVKIKTKHTVILFRSKKKSTSKNFTYWEEATGVWRCMVLGACAVRVPEMTDDRPPAAQRRAG